MDKEHKMLRAKQLRDLGLKQWEIARELNVTERTVRNYLKNPSAPRKQPVRKSKLDPHKKFIDSIIKDSPHYNCEILLDRLKSMGFTGKISILRDYVAGVRKKELQTAVIRFETEPGYQAQVDWGEFRRPRPDGSTEKLYAFKMTMGFSRRPFVVYTTSMKQSTLHACHIQAFKYFGGVPKEILYDNMKTAFIRDGEGIWRPNKKLSGFAEHYGFIPRRCQIRRPQTKGKVERAIGFLRTNFWPRVQDSVCEIEAINEAALSWLADVDQKALREFQETRAQRFEQEKACLLPLPEKDYDYRDVHQAIVNRESYITFQTNRYSVPPEYIGVALTLKVDPVNQTGELFNDGQSIRKIALKAAGSRSKVTLPEDRAAVEKLWRKQFSKKTKKKQVRPKHDREVATRSPASYDDLMFGKEVA